MNKIESIKKILLPNKKKIVITGGSGWFGLATLNLLDNIYKDELRNKVFIYGNGNKNYKLTSGRLVESRDISRIEKDNNLEGSLLFHYAYITKDKIKEQDIQKYTDLNRNLFLLLSRVIKKSPPYGIFYPSSGEVYRPIRRPDYITPYGTMKLESENILIELSRKLGIRCSVFRVFNVSGPYINKFGSYALEDILTNIIKGNHIRINSPHPVIRSYVSITDVIVIAFCTLLQSSQFQYEPIDCAGEELIEIENLAERCNLRTKKKNSILREKTCITKQEDFYVGDYLSWKRICNSYNYLMSSLDEQIDATYSYLYKYKNLTQSKNVHRN